MPSQASDSPAAQLAPENPSRFTPFDPARYLRLPHEVQSIWVRLDPPAGGWPREPLVLSIPGAAFETLSLWTQADAPPQRIAFTDVDDSHWHGHGRIAVPLLEPLGEGPLLLNLGHQGLGLIPLTLTLQSLPDYLQTDARWLAFASACLATLVLTALMAALFALRLRDAAYAYYVAYALSYALLQSVQTGYAFHPLRLDILGLDLLIAARIATVASVCFALLFLDRFADLSHYLPRLRRLLLVPAALLLGLMLLRLLPWAFVISTTRLLINALLVFAAILMPLLAALAWRRGSRYAGYFLVGWLPLMLATGLASAQAGGALPAWTWLDNAGLATGALEGVLLSLGLGERALAIRHERDQARRLADFDPLTGLLNRRAWRAQLSALLTDAQRRGSACAVLFVDLDHFKALNDRLGHEAGDRALVQVAAALKRELRPSDLLARYGGEEFVAALPACGEAEAQRVAERMRASVRNLAAGDSATERPMTASIGVAAADAGLDLAALIASADQAMYRAKAEGRDRVVVASTASTNEFVV